MAFISNSHSSNPIDRNAVSLDRHRRNWQRLTQGAATSTLHLDNITIGLNSSGQLEILPNGVGLAQQGWGVNKGDLLVYEGNNTYTNLGVGSDGEVLTADSAAPSGIEWAPAAGGSTAAGFVISSASGNIASGGTLVVTHPTDSSDERECWAAVSQSVQTTLVPNMTGYTTPSGNVTSSGEQSPNYAWQAFNNNLSTQWASQFNFPAWLQYKFTASTTVYGYAITAGTSVTDNQDPTAWTFAGSADGSSWTTLDTQTGITWAAGPQRQVFPLGSSATYQYYRITITANDGNGDNATAIAFMELLGASTTNVGPVYVGNTILNASLTDTFTATYTSGNTTTFTNNFSETLNAIVLVGTLVNGNSTFTLTTTGNTGLATLGNNTLNIPDYQGQIALTTTGTSGNATFGNNTLNVPNYGVTLLSTGGLAGNSTPLNLYVQGLQQLSSDPGSPIDGETWYNTTAQSPRFQQKGKTLGDVGLYFANTTSSSSVSNTTSPTVLNVTATLPANFFTVGKAVRINCTLDYSANTGVTLSSSMQMGGVTVATLPVTAAGAVSGARVFFEGVYCCRTTGVSGTFGRSGYVLGENQTGGANTSVGASGGTTVTIDTTSAITIQVTVTWSAASSANTVLLHQMSVEVLNN